MAQRLENRIGAAPFNSKTAHGMAPVKEDAVIRWPPKVAQQKTDAADFSGVLIRSYPPKKRKTNETKYYIPSARTNILERDQQDMNILGTWSLETDETIDSRRFSQPLASVVRSKPRCFTTIVLNSPVVVRSNSMRVFTAE